MGTIKPTPNMPKFRCNAPILKPNKIGKSEIRRGNWEMTAKAKQHNSIEREREFANADKPKPSKDLSKNWEKRHFAVFDQYLVGRAWVDWAPPNLRLLCQAVNLEIIILDSYELLATDGLMAIGGNGQSAPHPALAVITRCSATQGSLLRRLGIAVDGSVAPRDIKKSAAKAQTLQDSDTKSAASKLLAH